MNDRVETAGTRNRHEGTSRFMVQMTLPIRMLRHIYTPSPCCLLLNRSPLPPRASYPWYLPPQGKNLVDHVELPTIFCDRNLILSDVNQRRQERIPNFSARASSILFCSRAAHSTLCARNSGQIRHDEWCNSNILVLTPCDKLTSLPRH